MPQTTTATPWQVLVVRSRSERKVGQRLQDMGFQTCVPTQWQYRQWSDRRKKVEVVLFKNYVFIAADPKRRNLVFRDPNVLKYLRFGDRVATLTDEEARMVQGIKKLDVPVQITYDGLRAGEEVEILEGSLAGLRGQVLEVSGEQCIKLALPSLGCFACVEVKGVEVKRLFTASNTA